MRFSNSKKDHIHYGFILKKEPEKASVLMISERKGHFIKLRCTFIDDSFMRDIYNDFVAFVISPLENIIPFLYDAIRNSVEQLIVT